MTSTGFWRVLYVTAIVALVVALGRERASSQSIARNWDAYQEQLRRIRSIDELTGKQLPAALTVSDLDGRQRSLGEIGAWRAVWVLDPENCASCLDQVSRWNSAVEVLETVPALVLVGVEPVRARAMRESLGIRLAVYTADESFRVSAGFRMPSTYLYLDGHRVILLADAHSSHTSCEWSFPVQVATIAAGGSVGRSLRPSSPTPVQED